MIGRDVGEGRGRPWLVRRWPSTLLVCALIVLAVVSSVSSALLRREQVEGQRREVADAAADSLASTVEQLLAGLRGAGAVVGRDGEVSVRRFSSFARGVRVQPGISALGLGTIVTDRDRRAFERATGLAIVDRVELGEYVRAPHRARYYPVIAVTPSNRLSRSVLGLDVGNDPARGPITISALAAGVSQLTPPLQLFTTGEPGFLVIAPLYRHGVPLATTEDRTAAQVGFVTAAYRTDELVSLVQHQLPADTQLVVLDGGQALYGDPAVAPDAVTREVSVGGRRWLVGVIVPGNTDLVGPLGLLLAALALAGLVQLAISLARRREEALEASRRRLRADARRSEAMQTMAAALLDAHDVDAVVESMVRCAREATGAVSVTLGLLDEEGSSLEIVPVRGGGGASEDTIEGAKTTTALGSLPLDDDHAIVRVATSGISVFTEGTESPDGPTAVVPMNVPRATLGALAFRFPPSRRLDEDDRTLLEDLASTGARALEQARLFAAVDEARATAERERARVESQRRLSVELSRASTAEAAAGIVLTRVIAIAKAIAGGVALAHEDGYLEFVAVRGLADDDASQMPRLAIDDAAASSEAFRTGREVLAETTEAFRSRYPAGFGISGAEGRGVWALPLVVQGAPIGAVVLVLDEQHLPSRDVKEAVRALSAQVAQALRRAQTSDQTRAAAEELQRAMLPADLPVLAQASVHGLYRSAAQILDVGGDWYDALELSEDSLVMAVGDVVGRGLAAAATMGQLRVAWRALSQEAHGPASLLMLLDRFSRDLPGAEVTTVASAELECSTGTLRYASAGHLPPMVVDRFGRARFLEGGRSVPLAVVDPAPREESVTTMEPGDTVVLYTDGLVERRDESLDEGLERLRQTAEHVAGRDADRDRLGDALAAELIDEGTSVDDVAILTVTLRPSFHHIIERDPGALAPARAALRTWLDGHQVPEGIVEELVLASSEALANAIEHAHPTPEGSIEFRGWIDGARVVVHVADDGRWSERDPDPVRGNGLMIMRTLMDEVVVDREADGTRIELIRSLTRPPMSVGGPVGS
jgi:serine phosphatase RsbU (regulator of sigma subunit)/CHASE1-domain containing sensor protein/anti-sigma regulatory factor (Ser/Thr protein kinase)